MGNNASSRSRVENENVIINENDVSIFNKRINDMISNTIINNAKSCSASITELQKISFKDAKIAGDIDITIDQSQYSALTFDCLQISQVRNDIAQEVITKMMADLTENNKSDVLDKLNAIAKAKQETQGLPMSLANSSSTDTEVINKTRVENISRTNINEIIQNSVCNNFTSNDISNAIASVHSSQEANFENIDVGGKLVVAISQKQGSELVFKVIQTADIGNKITSDIINNLGIKKETTNATTTAQDVSSTGDSTNKSSDIFALGIGAISDFFSNLFKPENLMLFLSIACAIVIIIALGIYAYKKFGKKTDT